MLSVEHLSLYYGASQALRDVVASRRRPGEVTCILGRNGVGKTSLLRAIIGPAPDRRRRIRFEGRGPRRPQALRAGARSASATCRRAGRSSRCLTVRENLETGFASLPRRRAHDSRRGVRAVPGAADRCSAGAAATSPAASSSSSPSPGPSSPAPPARPRRADRRHPALDHQGHRPRHRLPAPSAATWPSCSSSSISSSPATSPTASCVMERGEVIVAGDRQALEGEDVRNRMAI